MLDTRPLPVRANISLKTSPEFITSTLVIPNVTTNDVGAYYCLVWAENKASRSNAGKLFFSGMCEANLHICTVQLNLNLTEHACSKGTTRHIFHFACVQAFMHT